VTKRTYEDNDLRVFWDSSLCIHTGKCIRAGNGVFDPQRRPWVEMNQADTATTIAAIESCPTGALRYERVDGSAGEQPQSPTTIVPWPNGPLMVRGELEVEDRFGGRFLTGPRAALCRCGDSANQPFCDLSHRDKGFRDNPKAPSSKRQGAHDPSEISEAPL
jgi:uncharacterized Fe-S cluster protein YjdI/CDGSH-type Zn-finger protein